jgi:hypothetical protein
MVHFYVCFYPNYGFWMKRRKGFFMQQDIAEKLLAAGVSQATIDLLSQEEYETEQDLQQAQFTHERLRAMGVKGKSADTLMRLYADVPLQLVAPQKVELVSSDPKTMRTPDLVRAIAGGEKDAQYIDELDRRVRGQAMFVRDANTGGIDAEESIILIADVGKGIPPKFWGSAPTETLADILQRKRFANPLTGEVLSKGDEWLEVLLPRRELAAYAVLAGLLQAPYDEDIIISQLSQEDLKGRWLRWQNAYTLAQSKATDASSVALVARARTAVYYQEGSHRSSQSSPFHMSIVSETLHKHTSSSTQADLSPSARASAQYTKPDRLVENLAEKVYYQRHASDACYTLMVEFMKPYGYMFNSVVLQNPYNLAAWEKLGTPYVVFLLRTLPPRMRTRENLAVIAQIHKGYYHLEEFVGVSDAQMDQMVDMDRERYGVFDLSKWAEWQDYFASYRFGWDDRIS